MHAVAVMTKIKMEDRCMCDSAKAAAAGYSIVATTKASSSTSSAK